MSDALLANGVKIVESNKHCVTPEQVQLLSNNMDANSNGIRDSINAVGHHADGTAQRIGLAGIDHANQNGVEGRVVTNQNGIDTRGSVERNGLEERLNANRNADHINDTVQRNAAEERMNVRHEGNRNQDSTEKFGFFNAKETQLFGLKNFEATKDGVKDLFVESVRSTDRIVCNDNANAKEIVLQAANNAALMQKAMCDLQLQQAKDTAAIQLEAAKNTAKIELDAARHAADLARQIAECCCENKALIIEKANQTDNLMRQLEENRLRDARQREHEELVALRLRASLLPALTPAVTI